MSLSHAESTELSEPVVGGLSLAGRPPGHSPESAGAPVGTSAFTISNAIVKLLRLRAGRGPNRAKATITSDLVVVHLRNCLTIAEKTLDETGLSAFVAKSREALHESIRPEATAVVEQVTGRRVVAYLSAQHSDPDHALIGFVLDGPPGRADGRLSAPR